MVFIFIMMVMLCATELVSDIVAGFVRRAREPRPRVARARQYRFN